MKSVLQLVSQRLLRDKLQEKLPRVTWPYSTSEVVCMPDLVLRTALKVRHL